MIRKHHRCLVMPSIPEKSNLDPLFATILYEQNKFHQCRGLNFFQGKTFGAIKQCHHINTTGKVLVKLKVVTFLTLFCLGFDRPLPS